MSSLALPPATTTTTGGKTFSSSSRYSSFLFFRSSTVPNIARNPNHRHHVVSCKTLDDDHQENSGKVDRRNALLGLGGLYGAANAFGSNPLAFAYPIKPDKCGPPDDLPPGVEHINCCPPPFPAEKIIDFRPPSPSTIRIRTATHLVDRDYIAKFNEAIKRMKALPDTDPRSFKNQALIHCAYCNGAYKQAQFPNLDIQVHKSCLFLPFHRQYLYFFEKICGKLIDDPNFAIPFWNWDACDGMEIPDMYTHRESPLYDPVRDSYHQPPSVVDLDYHMIDKDRSPEEQKRINLIIMYRKMVSSAKTPSLFMGSPYHAGDDPYPGPGSIETAPHDPLHIWTGDRTRPNFENMGGFYSAARDPIFYGHHANVDRMWYIWRNILVGEKRQDFTDSDWLDSFFYFYDENAKMVRFKVRDCLNTKKLGYTYQKVPITWLKSKPTPRPMKRMLSYDLPHPDHVLPVRLNRVIKLLVPRPMKEKEKDEEEEYILEIGIEVEGSVFANFDVLINEEDEGMSGPDKTEFAGSFLNLAYEHNHNKAGKIGKTTYKRLGISELLEDLHAEDDDFVVVTIDPKIGGEAVTIKNIKIVLDH